jgi:hypothetical protein
MTATVRATTFIAVFAGVAAGCTGNLETALQRLLEARALSSDLLVQFTKTADAGNRAVMADSDEASMAYAREAEEAMQAVQKDVNALAPILTALRYSDETGLLQDFGRQFAEYRTLNQEILGLAVENTNLKAQRLSFGASQQAADAFRGALDAVRRSATGADKLRAEAAAATAVAAVREIQVLQAPHIAEADDAAMTRMEKQMASSEASARLELKALAGFAPPGTRPQLMAAAAALDRFMGVNGEIVGLSRRNSEVRSLALSLGQKRMLSAQCEDTLRALQDALAKRSFSGTR